MAIREWAVLCASAGVDVRTLNSFDVYMLAGRIINDPQLNADVRKYAGSVAPKGLREKILATWSAVDRAALRERISGVLQIKTVTRKGDNA